MNRKRDVNFRVPLTAQEAVLGHLRQSILAGDWQPGEFIRQDSVAGQLGVSAIPVREALRTLEADGLVKYHPHRGYAVTELDKDDLVEIYRIRRVLEREAILQALDALSDEAMDGMRSAMMEMEATPRGDIAGLTASNRRFHFALFEAADMPRLQHLIRVLWDASDMYRSLYYMNDSALDVVNAEHRRIFEACEIRDKEAVDSLMVEHRNNAVALLVDILS